MLTGVGTTAKGPSVVDVLGTMKNKKGHFVDLDQALENMSGLQKNQNIEVLDRKLVKSKDIAISQKEEIDDLIASVGHAKTVDLSKKGDFVIQRPESIEGAASSDAKRDAGAINSVVSSHKLSIKMSYEKFLSRDPNLSGKITIKITIAASGSVTFVKAIENTTGSQELEEEIIRKISMWQFEPVPEGNVTITYPFVFMPSS
jgi:TonB family protein